MSNRIRRKAPLTFFPANHGVKVRRGFNEIFLTWKSIRELEAMRTMPRAESWFYERLRNGPVDPIPLCRDARRQGFSTDLIWRVRRSLGVVTRRKNHVRVWALP
jgi:hypothetical protein